MLRFIQVSGYDTVPQDEATIIFAVSLKTAYSVLVDNAFSAKSWGLIFSEAVDSNLLCSYEYFFVTTLDWRIVLSRSEFYYYLSLMDYAYREIVRSSSFPLSLLLSNSCYDN